MPVNLSLPFPITLCLNDLFSCYIIHISDLQQLNLSVIHSQAHFVEMESVGILPKDRRHCAGDTLQLLQKPFPLGQVYCKPLCDPHTSADVFVPQSLHARVPHPISYMPMMRENSPKHVFQNQTPRSVAERRKQAAVLTNWVQFLTADICVTVIHSGGMWKCAPAESPNSTTPRESAPNKHT